MKAVVCYSGGHSSALVAIEAVRKYGKDNVILLNHDISPKVEHEDIKRFKSEVADYLGLPITYANMDGWETKDQFDVCIELGAFKYGIQSSALCTQTIKTEPFKKWLSDNYPTIRGELRDDITVMYGFDAAETLRINRRVGVMATLGYKTDYPLLWANRTINEIEEVGISRPVTYETFNHANCIGCLKAGKQHWFAVYCLYPDVFARAKFAESEIGYSILRQGFLEKLEHEFESLKANLLTPTEKISPQKFWAKARKLLKDDVRLPCECAI